jgi:hypothetical protein
MKKLGKELTGKDLSVGVVILLMSTIVLTFSSCNNQEAQWLRGNMHTHTFWSDGNDFPEIVTKWYKENGYDFLVLTDHNNIHEGERWRDFAKDNPTLLKYAETFGADWVEMQPDENNENLKKVRLKTFGEYRSMFEEPGKFLLMMGNEISNPHAVHLLAFHQDRVIQVSQKSVGERDVMIRETVDRVGEFRQQSGVNTWPVLAHPNFTWAITAEMILNNPGLRFFEVYNGHPRVNNDGDEFRAGTERIWDIVLANRLSDNSGEILYGLATDDAHQYHGGDVGPGKGWVMVRSKMLSPEAILDAIDRGNFYSSTGVTLKKISFNGKSLKIEIEPREGVEYITEFIGTPRGFDPSCMPTADAAGNEIDNTTRTYSKDIGQVLATSRSLTPSYTFSGDELYVRARITSTADQIDPLSGANLGKQKAWVQPQLQGMRR